MKYIAYIALLFIVIPIFAFAHTTGASYEEIVGKYRIDIGYDPEKITTETQARFDFSIFDIDTGEKINFSRVWFRVLDGEETIFAGGLARTTPGNTSVLYRPPHTGTLTVYARFESDDEVFAETTFPINVEALPARPSFNYKNSLPWLFLGLLIGVILGLVLKRPVLKG